MLKRAGLLVLALTLAACDSDNDSPTGPTAGPIVFTAELSAANEVPPVTNAESGGRGTAVITFGVPRDSSGNVAGPGTVNFSLQLTGFPTGTSVVGAHIHPGAAGTTGPVLVGVQGVSGATPVVLADGTSSRVFSPGTISQENAQRILANPAGFYFNVHTPLNPGGAVRGQLARSR